MRVRSFHSSWAGVTLLVISASPLSAQTTSPASPPTWDASLGVKIATTGYGVEVAKLLSSHFAARVAVNFGSYNTNQTKNDVTYDASIKARGTAVLLDIFPPARGSFHFTTGLHTNPISIVGSAVPSGQGTIKLNNREYPASQVGVLTASVKLPSTAPYLGIGFGTPATRHGSVKLRFDLGAILGKPKVLLNATGAANNAQLAADVAAEQAKTQKDINSLAAYPVLAIGLAYKR